jgi:hypothetical protein
LPTNSVAGDYDYPDAVENFSSGQPKNIVRVHFRIIHNEVLYNFFILRYNKYCRSHTNVKKEGHKILPQQTSLVSALCKKEREKDSKMSLNFDVCVA